MLKKKVIWFSIITVFLVAIVAFIYFRFWQEPTAQYIKTDDSKLIRLRNDLKEYKDELKRKGLYACCIKNDCNWCAIHMGHCNCAELVKKDGVEKSCPECAAAWNKKQGKIPGVDPKAIQVTTFGIYGFEKEGHHHPDFIKDKKEEEHSEHHHEDEDYH